MNTLEKEVFEEMRSWSAQLLEMPNKHFNNLPACPFAKKAWAEDKVGFCFNYNQCKQALYKLITNYPDKYDVCLFIEFDYEKNSQKFHDYLNAMNGAIAQGIFIDKDIWVMGFHPDDEPEDQGFIDEPVFDEEAFEPVNDTVYAVTYIQRLSKLEESAQIVKEKGYYSVYKNNPEVINMYAQRHQLYRRLNNGRKNKA